MLIAVWLISDRITKKVTIAYQHTITDEDAVTDENPIANQNAITDQNTVTYQHSGKSNFTILAYTNAGRDDLLANEIGAVSGSTTYRPPAPGSG